MAYAKIFRFDPIAKTYHPMYSTGREDNLADSLIKPNELVSYDKTRNIFKNELRSNKDEEDGEESPGFSAIDVSTSDGAKELINYFSEKEEDLEEYFEEDALPVYVVARLKEALESDRQSTPEEKKIKGLNFIRYLKQFKIVPEQTRFVDEASLQDWLNAEEA